ncbi:hypothetical protein D3C76_1716350 [compost metagenome]
MLMALELTMGRVIVVPIVQINMDISTVAAERPKWRVSHSITAPETAINPRPTMI